MKKKIRTFKFMNVTDEWNPYIVVALDVLDEIIRYMARWMVHAPNYGLVYSYCDFLLMRYKQNGKNKIY